MSATSAVSRARIEDKGRFVPPPPDSALSIAEKMRTQGSACLRVSGGSMIPWVRPGDFIFIRRFDFGKVSPGDVIVFQRNGLVVVHRAIRRAKAAPSDKIDRLLITKGDASNETDAPVSAEEYLGHATRIHRGRHHIDLESLTQKLLGRFLARISRLSRYVYFPMRFGKQLLFR
ncbi:MAG TPA: signal peptidase I [Candidatus Acidoferrales bacterium]|nr:signal peptidase I [Candidatus Acidoferrales bacterium]